MLDLPPFGIFLASFCANVSDNALIGEVASGKYGKLSEKKGQLPIGASELSSASLGPQQQSLPITMNVSETPYHPSLCALDQHSLPLVPDPSLGSAQKSLSMPVNASKALRDPVRVTRTVFEKIFALLLQMYLSLFPSPSPFSLKSKSILVFWFFARH